MSINSGLTNDRPPHSRHPRFDVLPPPVTVVYCDRVRLTSFDDLGRFYVGASADDPAIFMERDPPIWLDLPMVDRKAYERAIVAFNTVMDEHERQIAAGRPSEPTA